MRQQICILGSTGSIGTQALEVISEHSDRFEAYCLTANNKIELLAEQARKYKPACVVIANEKIFTSCDELLRNPSTPAPLHHAAEVFRRYYDAATKLEMVTEEEEW